MVRSLAASEPRSATSRLLRRVLVQMADLSPELCARLLRSVLDYAAALLAGVLEEAEDGEASGGPPLGGECSRDGSSASDGSGGELVELGDEIDPIYGANFMDESSV